MRETKTHIFITSEEEKMTFYHVNIKIYSIYMIFRLSRLLKEIKECFNEIFPANFHYK
jgi:hypothetical protein